MKQGGDRCHNTGAKKEVLWRRRNDKVSKGMGPHSSTAPMGWCSGLVSAHSPVVSQLFLKVLPLIEQAREEPHYWGQQSDHFSTRQPGLRGPSIYQSCLGTSALGPGAHETM